MDWNNILLTLLTATLPAVIAAFIAYRKSSMKFKAEIDALNSKQQHELEKFELTRKYELEKIETNHRLEIEKLTASIQSENTAQSNSMINDISFNMLSKIMTGEKSIEEVVDFMNRMNAAFPPVEEQTP